MIFNSAKGSGPRSLILLRNFLETGELAEEGRLLDIGCSNGNLLKSFHSLRPRWKLSGAELVDQWKETVLALPGVEAFYSGPNPAYDWPFRRHFTVACAGAHSRPDPLPQGDLRAISRRRTPSAGRAEPAAKSQRSHHRRPLQPFRRSTALPTWRARRGSAVELLSSTPACPRSWSPCCPSGGRRRSAGCRRCRSGRAPGQHQGAVPVLFRAARRGTPGGEGVCPGKSALRHHGIFDRGLLDDA